MKIKTKVMSLCDVEIDTDTFTVDQWKRFIIDNVNHQEIKRTIESDLFWQDRLKARAIQVFQAKQDFDLFG